MIQEQNIPIDRNGANGYCCNGIRFLVNFPCKLYILDSKNEIHNDIRLNSIPSQIVLIEESFISPIPNEFILKTL